jgi:hypothetical protein
VVFAVLALAATVLVALPAVANGPEVETGAEIGGGGDDAPIIVCKWELPDYDRDHNNGMQYGDDDMPAIDAGYPCRGVDPNTEYVPGVEVIQVKANAEDQPTERWIELWSAVRGNANSDDVDSVFWDIYHPDGSLKVQVHGYHAGPPQGYGASFNTTTGQYDLHQGGMWYAASNQTGQIAQDTARSQQGIIARAAQQDLWLFNNGFYLSKHQPCGHYIVHNYATFSGDTSHTWNYIYVMCFINLEVDFDTVQWGAITPGGTDWVYGDLVFDPGSSAYPTVKNTGSGAMSLGIVFSDMVRPEDQDPNTIKRISDFDGAFGINPDYLTYRRGPGGEELYFGTEWHQILCANETGKLDLSIHPPVGLPAGHYVGELALFGYHTPDEGSPCLNEHGDWHPPYARYPDSNPD